MEVHLYPWAILVFGASNRNDNIVVYDTKNHKKI